MATYENEIKKKYDANDSRPERIDIGIIRYLWQSSALSFSRKDSVPKFLRGLGILSNFTDNELRIFSKFLHVRTFHDKEVIFNQGDQGIGFYFIQSGNVDIIVENLDVTLKNEASAPDYNLVITLEKSDYFGELSLLQPNSIRSATAVAKNTCSLLGIFNPDLQELISLHPVVGTKLLQSMAQIVADRLLSITKEVKELKYKLSLKEEVHDKIENSDLRKD